MPVEQSLHPAGESWGAGHRGPWDLRQGGGGALSGRGWGSARTTVGETGLRWRIVPMCAQRLGNRRNPPLPKVTAASRLTLDRVPRRHPVLVRRADLAAPVVAVVGRGGPVVDVGPERRVRGVVRGAEGLVLGVVAGLG